MPFVLVDDLKRWSYVFVPLLTYGFWGLETVAVTLSDPFGSDTNDLDIQMVVDDCFATIADDYAPLFQAEHIDGPTLLALGAHARTSRRRLCCAIILPIIKSEGILRVFAPFLFGAGGKRAAAAKAANLGTKKRV